MRDFDDLQTAIEKQRPHLVVSKAQYEDIVAGFGYDAASTVGFSMRNLYNIQSFMEETRCTVDIHQSSRVRRLTTVEEFIAWRDDKWGSYYNL